MVEPMSELEEQIAKVGYETKAARVFPTFPKWEKLTPDGCQQEDWRAVARDILKLEPIRELLGLHGEGKLVVLDDNQTSLTDELGNVLDDYDQYSLCLHRALQEKFDGFKRVHPPGVKCPSKP